MTVGFKSFNQIYLAISVTASKRLAALLFGLKDNGNNSKHAAACYRTTKKRVGKEKKLWPK
jgi:hypothetical protein